jgi:mono/diheme cytochrome c family protein
MRGLQRSAPKRRHRTEPSYPSCKPARVRVFVKTPYEAAAVRALLPAALALVALLGITLLAQTADHPRWTAPPAASAKQNPLSDRPQLAAGGKKIFARLCARCHESGPDRKGPELSDAMVQNETDGALFWKISTGNSRSGMPGYSSLPEAQRWQIVLYIRSIARH